MSNTKKIIIEGTLPFNCAENENIKGWLASMNSPCFGLRIKWSGSPKTVPNEHGGQTAMYDFKIEGTEAVSYDAIEELVDSILEIGELEYKRVVDLDA